MVSGNPIGKTRPNYLYSVISVALVLFTLGFFAMAIFNARQLVHNLKERVNLIVELQPDVQKSEIETIRQGIEQSPFSIAGSVVFTSKEQAAEIMREDFGEDFLKLDLPNPLYDVLTFNVRSAYLEPDSLKAIRNMLVEQAGVVDVYYQEGLVNEIARNIQSISLIAIVVLAFFIFISVALIHNTVRLALYANRFLIKNMELVGASWEFISHPYIRRGTMHGLFSGLLASVGLFLLFLWIQSDIPGLRSLVDWVGLIMLFALLLALGMAINTLSTYYVVRKYLKMRVDDLY
ncbi:MAG: ABC transporter permease [Phaeodactylibacter sp.]|nr:ABC transporter permease [Phaeodactylibacter sp.]MCB9263708.1 ABC transporter permease [Lewinellaceae bacterium]MCB9286885.1 ABC transporter permease [Lewinellaceae bacterium]